IEAVVIREPHSEGGQAGRLAMEERDNRGRVHTTAEEYPYRNVTHEPRTHRILQQFTNAMRGLRLGSLRPLARHGSCPVARKSHSALVAAPHGASGKLVYAPVQRLRTWRHQVREIGPECAFIHFARHQWV